MPPRSARPIAGPLFVLTASAVGGFAYRYWGISDDDETSTRLNPSTFTQYTITARQPVSSTSSIISLRPPRDDADGKNKPAIPAKAGEELKDWKDIWNRGVWSVQIKQPQLQIARSYTPLPPSSATTTTATAATTLASSSPSEQDGRRLSSSGITASDDILRLYIRTTPSSGEVPAYISSQPLYSTLTLRGPTLELEIPPHVREVVFLAGGTGIAPALQVASILAQRPGAKMTVLWAVKRREEVAGAPDAKAAPKVHEGSRQAETSGFGSWLRAGPKDRNPPKGGGVVEEKGVLVKELEGLQQRFKAATAAAGGEGGKMNVEYFVDEENTLILPRNVAKYLRDDRQSGAENVPGSKLLVVSGPEGFIDVWAGKKVWMGGQQIQGPLNGLLKFVDTSKWRVWKL